MMRGVLVAPFLLGASQAPPIVPAAHPAKPGDGFEVSSYDVALTPNISNKAVAGRETITLRPTHNGVQRLIFSGNALVIDSATIDGVPVLHNNRGDALDFDLPRPLRRGRSVMLRLSYHGRPARGFAGSATTLYTSYFACDWMVCSQNTFGEKAAFTLDLTIPAGMTSLSVGAMVTKRRGPDGTEVHRWRAPRPYSAYLYGFAVGPFTKVSERSRPNRLTYLSDVATSEELKRRFAETPDMGSSQNVFPNVR